VALPDFFVIGAPKAGSTAIHAALAQHRQLFLSPVKEPKFFMTDGPPARSGQRGPGDAHSAREWVHDPRAYEALFDAAKPGQLRGESTPFYLWDRAAHMRMHDLVPDAKLIAIIRDPVDRAYSNWTHLWCNGLEPEADFLRACELESDRADRGWAPFWRYLELGRYGEQLRHLYSVYDRSQVHLLRYRQLVDDPVPTLDGICRFLGIQTGLLGGVGAANVSTWVPDTRPNAALRRVIRGGAHLGQFAPAPVWRIAERPLLRSLHRGHRNRPEPDAAVRRELTTRFAEDIALLGDLTGESYADWLSAKGRGTYSVRRS
jgi:Sulfotransferase family